MKTEILRNPSLVGKTLDALKVGELLPSSSGSSPATVKRLTNTLQ